MKTLKSFLNEVRLTKSLNLIDIDEKKLKIRLTELNKWMKSVMKIGSAIIKKPSEKILDNLVSDLNNMQDQIDLLRSLIEE